MERLEGVYITDEEERPRNSREETRYRREERRNMLISRVLNTGGGVHTRFDGDGDHIRFEGDLFEEEAPVKGSKKRKQKGLFPYGNERGYYKKRIGSHGIDDPRLLLYDGKWFTNKDVMDVGCHEGYIAITLAQMYTVKSMRGVDIDAELVTLAYQHLEEEAAWPSCAAPLVELDVDAEVDVVEEEINDEEINEEVDTYNLLERVSFEAADFLVHEIEEGCVDTILCLSVTKWVHLNWGDAGLMTLFRKMHSALRPGGVLILESQSWKSYRHNRNLTDAIHQVYLKLALRPDDFPRILVDEVGFKSCEVVAGNIPSTWKGFDRPIYLYTK